MKLYVRDWRLRRGLSQEEAARRAGIRQATWSKLERGLTTPHRVTLEAVARALAVQPARLYRRPPKVAA